MCGKLSTLQADNFLYSINTTRDIACHYYCARDLQPVAVAVRDSFISDNSFYANKDLNEVRKKAQEKSKEK